MPEINVKSYNEAVATLEKMADGAARHKGEPDFPSAVKEEAFRTRRQELEDARTLFDEAETRLRQRCRDYQAVLEKARTEITAAKSMMYGFYGKKNPVVADFGLAPYKERKTGKKEAPPTK